MLDFVGVGEADFLEAGVNLRGLHIVWKLTYKGGGYKCDAVLVVVQQFEVVLLDVYCVAGADLEAFSAVDAFVAVNHRLAFPDSDGFGRTRPQAVCASCADIAVNAKCMVKV